MPYSMKKVRGKKCYKVFNRITKRVTAKCTTLDKAKRQIRLLNALENNKKFILYPRKGTQRRR